MSKFKIGDIVNVFVPSYFKDVIRCEIISVGHGLNGFVYSCMRTDGKIFVDNLTGKGMQDFERHYHEQFVSEVLKRPKYL